MQKSIKKNLLTIICFAFAISLAFAVVLCLPKDKVIAEDFSGFAVSEYATVETNDNGDKLLKFKTEVGSDFLTANNSSVYTFGTLIFPKDNGSIDTSKTLAENEEILDSVNIVAKSSQEITESFTYNASILFDKETLTTWILSQKPELEDDEEGLETALNKVYENLYSKNFTAVSYAVTDSGVIYSNNLDTSVNQVEEFECSTEGVVYKIVNNSYAQVTDYTGTATDVVIASRYQGYPVTSIGYRAFSNCYSLTSIEIPNSITSIGQDAFEYCSSLTAIEIGNGVTSISDAFTNCNALSYVNYLGTIDEWAQIEFMGSRSNPLNYAGKLYINDVLVTEAKLDIATEISDFAFWNCDSLVSVEISNSVTSIGDNAFYSCSSLTSIEIPNSVTSIGSYAFKYCSKLTTVTFEENSQLRSIGDEVFYNCTSLASIEIPNSVTSIDSYAFKYCSSLTTVTFEENSQLTSIGYEVFHNCTSLTSIEIPNSVTSIDSYAFKYCSSLTTVTFGDNSQLTSVGREAFMECALTSIEMPNTVISIGDRAFVNCSSLTSIEIPNSVTTIGYQAFVGCSSLTSIEIPNSVTIIGDEAFNDCSSLSYVNYFGTIDEWAQIKFISIRSNPIYYAKGLYINGELVTKVKLTTATKISDYAFVNCWSLTSIEIPNSVTTIGSTAFDDCFRLVEVINRSSYFTVEKGSWEYGSVGKHALNVINNSEEYVSKVSTDNNGYIIYTNGNDKILVSYVGSEKDLFISSDITAINKYVFYEYDNLTSISFGDVYTWYATSNQTDWINKTGGDEIDVTSSLYNVVYFGSYSYNRYNYYWYKL